MGRHSFTDTPSRRNNADALEGSTKKERRQEICSLRQVVHSAQQSLVDIFKGQALYAWSITVMGDDYQMKQEISGTEDTAIREIVRSLNGLNCFLYRKGKQIRGLEKEDFAIVEIKVDEEHPYPGFELVLDPNSPFEPRESLTLCQIRVELVPVKDIQLQMSYTTKLGRSD